MGRVIVVGSINLDVITLVDRIPLAGETIFGRPGGRGLGGKGANQALAALRAGGDVQLVGCVGQDSVGDEILGALRDYGLSVDDITRVEGATGYAQILVGGGDNQIVVVSGANRSTDLGRVNALAFRPDDICVAQLEVETNVIATAFMAARAAGARTLLNVAPADLEALAPLLPLTDIVVANELEWQAMLGAPLDQTNPGPSLLSAAEMPALRNASILIATLGEDGVCAASRGEVLRLDAVPVQVIDTTGAGDCFCGYLAAALARRVGLAEALALANTAAALAVGTIGAAASLPGLDAVEASLSTRTPQAARNTT